MEYMLMVTIIFWLLMIINVILPFYSRTRSIMLNIVPRDGVWHDYFSFFEQPEKRTESIGAISLLYMFQLIMGTIISFVASWINPIVILGITVYVILNIYTKYKTKNKTTNNDENI